jgi:hypothetical protein
MLLCINTSFFKHSFVMKMSANKTVMTHLAH